MFRRLRIQNFKAWRDTGDIRLAPITVFFGSNSAGKSSLLQFLLMLKQTAESPDRRRVLHTGDQHSPVDLGTFRDLIHDHDLAASVAFDLEWSFPQRRAGVTAGDRISFSASIGSDPETSRLGVRYMAYDLAKAGELVLTAGMMRTRSQRDKYKLTTGGFRAVRNPGRAWSLPAPVRFYGFPNEVFAYYQNADSLSDLVLALEQQLRRIQYLGPLRNRPARMYTSAGEIREHVGWTGEWTVEALLAAADREISFGPKQRKRRFPEIVAEWLSSMGLLESFEARPIAKHRREYEVVVRAKGSREKVALTDVGFGVSQVLPVLVECFYVPAHSTIIMEQPELHLHPSVQSALADLFIAAIRARENGGERNIQLIIESHSEHFLRRLQLRIAEENLPPESVALYFCEAAGNASQLRELDVDLYGNITNWPSDFFGDEMADRAAMMDAIVDRRLKGSQ
jgi:predicted ATPase